VKGDRVLYWFLCGSWCSAGAVAMGALLTYLTNSHIGILFGLDAGPHRISMVNKQSSEGRAHGRRVGLTCNRGSYSIAFDSRIDACLVLRCQF
jgi:hypothetical protein